MRDVILDQISYGVWTQLIVRAACAIDHEGEVDYEWQRTVIESFGRQLYEVNDATEAALRLRNEIDDRRKLPHLVERIDSELQEFIDPRSQLINLMEEGLQI
jgi:leucyl-tRNA synthetase